MPDWTNCDDLGEPSSPAVVAKSNDILYLPVADSALCSRPPLHINRFGAKFEPKLVRVMMNLDPG